MTHESVKIQQRAQNSTDKEDNNLAKNLLNIDPGILHRPHPIRQKNPHQLELVTCGAQLKTTKRKCEYLTPD